MRLPNLLRKSACADLTKDAVSRWRRPENIKKVYDQTRRNALHRDVPAQLQAMRASLPSFARGANDPFNSTGMDLNAPLTTGDNRRRLLEGLRNFRRTSPLMTANSREQAVTNTKNLLTNTAGAGSGRGVHIPVDEIRSSTDPLFQRQLLQRRMGSIDNLSPHMYKMRDTLAGDEIGGAALRERIAAMRARVIDAQSRLLKTSAARSGDLTKDAGIFGAIGRGLMYGAGKGLSWLGAKNTANKLMAPAQRVAKNQGVLQRQQGKLIQELEAQGFRPDQAAEMAKRNLAGVNTAGSDNVMKQLQGVRQNLNADLKATGWAPGGGQANPTNYYNQYMTSKGWLPQEQPQGSWLAQNGLMLGLFGVPTAMSMLPSGQPQANPNAYPGMQTTSASSNNRTFIDRLMEKMAKIQLRKGGRGWQATPKAPPSTPVPVTTPQTSNTWTGWASDNKLPLGLVGGGATLGGLGAYAMSGDGKPAGKGEKKAMESKSASTAILFPAAGAAIGGAVGGPEGAVMGGAVGGGAAAGTHLAWAALANKKLRDQVINSAVQPIQDVKQARRLTSQFNTQPTGPDTTATPKHTAMPKETFNNAKKNLPVQYAAAAPRAGKALFSSRLPWILGGAGAAAAGLGTAAAMMKGGSDKSAGLEDLAEAWNKLDTTGKLTTGAGGALALGSLLYPGELSPAARAVGATAGLGLGAYGLAGNNVNNILPTLSTIAMGKPKPAPGGLKLPAQFTRADGSPDFLKLVNARDEELKQALGTMDPAVLREQKPLLRQELANFKPSLTQSLGARAMGIDIAKQKERFNQLLS